MTRPTEKFQNAFEMPCNLISPMLRRNIYKWVRSQGTPPHFHEMFQHVTWIDLEYYAKEAEEEEDDYEEDYEDDTSSDFSSTTKVDEWK